MKLVKTFSYGPSGRSYSIYELSDKEIQYTDAPGKYLLHDTYGDYAMNRMSKIDMIQRAINESVYVYGVAFCDTVKEAELYLKCSILECRINSIYNVLRDFGDEFERIDKTKVSVFDTLK